MTQEAMKTGRPSTNKINKGVTEQANANQATHQTNKQTNEQTNKQTNNQNGKSGSVLTNQKLKHFHRITTHAPGNIMLKTINRIVSKNINIRVSNTLSYCHSRAHLSINRCPHQCSETGLLTKR